MPATLWRRGRCALFDPRCACCACCAGALPAQRGGPARYGPQQGLAGLALKHTHVVRRLLTMMALLPPLTGGLPLRRSQGLRRLRRRRGNRRRSREAAGAHRSAAAAAGPGPHCLSEPRRAGCCKQRRLGCSLKHVWRCSTSRGGASSRLDQQPLQKLLLLLRPIVLRCGDVQARPPAAAAARVAAFRMLGRQHCHVLLQHGRRFRERRQHQHGIAADLRRPPVFLSPGRHARRSRMAGQA